MRFLILVLLVAAHHAHAAVSVDPDAGIIKGLDTGLNYDRKAEVLYDDDGVIETDIKFVDLLFDCTLESGGQVCADVISGTYGFHDFGAETYANPDFWVDYKSAYYEPISGGWLDNSMVWSAADAVQAAFAEAERALFARWRFYSGDLVLLATEMAALEADGALFTMNRPIRGVPEVQPPVPWRRMSGHGQAWPKELPAGSVVLRIDKHCDVLPRDDLGGSSASLTSQIRDFVKSRFDSYAAAVALQQSRAAALAAENGQTSSTSTWQRALIEQPFLHVLDNLDAVYVLTQRNAGTLAAVALVNVRQADSGVVLDWWATGARYAVENSDGSISVRTHVRGNILDHSAMFGLAYSNACLEGQQ